VDFSQVDVYSAVTLVDRTGQGGTEFIFDGIRFVFAPGQTEMTVPKFVAKWLLEGDRCKVWSAAGEFVPRYAVKGQPQDVQEIIDACGPEVADDTRLDLKTGLLEGSAVAELDPAKLDVRPITIPRSELRERQGSGSRAGFGNER
jgi:hypothetical protein